jgi:hypothetical protein
MTQEEKRIKLAEAGGWKFCREDNKTWRTPQQAAKNKELLGHESGPWSFESSGPPDYFSDLNAVHELEKVIERLCKEGDYWFHLRELCDFPDAECDWGRVNFFTAIHATAANRAEALGLTLNLW